MPKLQQYGATRYQVGYGLWGDIVIRLRLARVVVGAVFATLVTVVATAIAILQFAGVANLRDLLPKPASTSTPPLPVVALYQTNAPGCITSTDPPYLRWRQRSPDSVECVGGTKAAILHEGDRCCIGSLLLRTENHRFAANATLSVAVENLRADTCVGVGSRESVQDNRAYILYVCGNGDWYIMKYSAEAGIPFVLSQSTMETRDRITTNTTLVATLLDNQLQLVINGGPAHKVADAEFSDTGQISISCTGEDTLETYLESRILASVTITHFYYHEL